MTAHRLDDQFAQAIAQLPPEFMEMPEPPADDVRALRDVIDYQYTEMGELAPPVPAGVDREDVSIPVGGGVTLEARWYTKGDARPGSAVVSRSARRGGCGLGGAVSSCWSRKER